MRFSVLGRRRRISLLNRRLFICVLVAFMLLGLSSAAFAFGTGNVAFRGTARIHIDIEPAHMAIFCECAEICPDCGECLLCGECLCEDYGYIYDKDEDEYCEEEKNEGEYDDNDTVYEDENNDYPDDKDTNDETEENGEDYPDVSEPDVNEPDVSEPDVNEPDVNESDVNEPEIDQNDEPETTEPDSGQTSEEYVPATTPDVEQPPNEPSFDAVQNSPVDSGSEIDSNNVGSGEPVSDSQDD